MSECIYAEHQGKTENGCFILVCACKPDRCRWYKTEEQMLESLAQAHRNSIKRGKDDYIETSCPPIYREKLRRWEHEHESLEPV